MIDQIVKYVTEHPRTSFVELCRDVPGFAGKRAMVTENNVVLWDGISAEAVQAMWDLLERNVLDLLIGHNLHYSYMVDGILPNLPLATRLNYKYKRPRWMPVLFKLTQCEST